MQVSPHALPFRQTLQQAAPSPVTVPVFNDSVGRCQERSRSATALIGASEQVVAPLPHQCGTTLVSSAASGSATTIQVAASSAYWSCRRMIDP